MSNKLIKVIAVVALCSLVVIGVTRQAVRAVRALAPEGAAEQPILELRHTHETVLLKRESFGPEDLPPLAHSTLEYTSYETDLGLMDAIASRIREDGVRRPAIVWDFGGFGGIFDGYADYHGVLDDQGVRQFIDAGFVVFLPTVRGEYNNTGVFECFYGEVEDLVRAVEAVVARADVDPDRVYLMGHSTGGTNALLAAAMTELPAAVVSFGGAVDMRMVAQAGGYGPEPYSLGSRDEIELRSPILFTEHFRCPVLSIEGADSWFGPELAEMDRIARRSGVDFRFALIEGADHWSVLAPLKTMLADWVEEGKPGLPTRDELQRAFDSF